MIQVLRGGCARLLLASRAQVMAVSHRLIADLGGVETAHARARTHSGNLSWFVFMSSKEEMLMIVQGTENGEMVAFFLYIYLLLLFIF